MLNADSAWESTRSCRSRTLAAKWTNGRVRTLTHPEITGWMANHSTITSQRRFRAVRSVTWTYLDEAHNKHAETREARCSSKTLLDIVVRLERRFFCGVPGCDLFCVKTGESDRVAPHQHSPLGASISGSSSGRSLAPSF